MLVTGATPVAAASAAAAFGETSSATLLLQHQPVSETHGAGPDQKEPPQVRSRALKVTETFHLAPTLSRSGRGEGFELDHPRCLVDLDLSLPDLRQLSASFCHTTLKCFFGSFFVFFCFLAFFLLVAPRGRIVGWRFIYVGWRSKSVVEWRSLCYVG